MTGTVCLPILVDLLGESFFSFVQTKIRRELYDFIKKPKPNRQEIWETLTLFPFVPAAVVVCTLFEEKAPTVVKFGKNLVNTYITRQHYQVFWYTRADYRGC